MPRALVRSDRADLGPAPLPPDASPGRRWRFRRDLVIYLAHRRNGLSQRFLADVFDLPHSRIGTIVRNFDRFDRAGDAEPDGIPG